LSFCWRHFLSKTIARQSQRSEKKKSKDHFCLYEGRSKPMHTSLRCHLLIAKQLSKTLIKLSSFSIVLVKAISNALQKNVEEKTLNKQRQLVQRTTKTLDCKYVQLFIYFL
jgi:hypothetical protein